MTGTEVVIGDVKDERDAVQIVADEVRSQIVSGAIKPGERIFEAQLARQFGTSRTALREAARLLEREGLLELHANRGFRVRELTIRELIDLTETRICVERHAVRIITALPDKTELIAQLRKALAEISDSVATQDRLRESEADFRFHRSLVEYTGNRKLTSIYDQLATELRISMRMMGFSPNLWEQLPELHASVIDCIESGDAAKAEEAIEQHIREAWQETLQQIPSTMDMPVGALMGR
jgi:DNA-binding GntR family transcriptional regulator